MMIGLPIIISNKPLHSKRNERKLDNEDSSEEEEEEEEEGRCRVVCFEGELWPRIPWSLPPRRSILPVQLK
jgi:hypothetical protein